MTLLSLPYWLFASDELLDFYQRMKHILFDQDASPPKPEEIRAFADLVEFLTKEGKLP